MGILHGSAWRECRMLLFYVISAAVPSLIAAALLSIYQFSGGDLIALESQDHESLIEGLFFVLFVVFLSFFSYQRVWEFYFRDSVVNKYIRKITSDYYPAALIWFFLMLIFLDSFISGRDVVFRLDEVNPLNLIIVFVVAILLGLLELALAMKVMKRRRSGL